MLSAAMLGLGTMGHGMAENLLRKGFPLAVWNRNPARGADLAKAGARFASTPREAATGADIVLAMVADDAASRAVWLGPDGALADARKGAIIVECSTLTPGWIAELAGEAARKGCGFLDAPVGGSKAAAEGGQLVLFVGGEGKVLEEARPALEAISRKINHLGAAGAGATWKLINNMLVAVHMASFAKAMTMAERAGFDRRQAAELIANSAAASPIVQLKAGRVAERSYDGAEFTLALMAKDTRYVVELARRLGVPSALAEAVAADFARGVDAGLADKDFAAVAEIDRK
jgi:3-hydroxyisobutyrate dehydrogenase